MEFCIHRKDRTESTNLDARAGVHGDVFTAREQTAGRGRLGHKWYARAGENLTFSVVLSVADLPREQVMTLPLVVGLAVRRVTVEGGQRPLHLLVAARRCEALARTLDGGAAELELDVVGGYVAAFRVCHENT